MATLRKESSIPVTTQHLSPNTVQSKPLYALRYDLHQYAVDTGASCYVDPISHDIIASSTFLMRHTELCQHTFERHCPHVERTERGVFEFVVVDGKGVERRVPRKGSSDSLANIDIPEHRYDGSVGDDDGIAGAGGREKSSSSSSSASAASSSSSEYDQHSMKRLLDAMVVVPKGLNDAQTLGIGSDFVPQRRTTTAIVSPFMRPHTQPLHTHTLCEIEDILRLPHYAQVGRFHTATVNRGLDCYRDPHNGCIFFTRPFLEGARCCGQECRHCPYGHSTKPLLSLQQDDQEEASSRRSSSDSSCSYQSSALE